MKANEKNGWHLHPLMWLVVFLAVASVLLFAVSIFIPPEGEVHKTVLEGLGIITIDIALVIFAYAVISGKTATFTHGNTTATVGRAIADAPTDEPQTEY